MSKAFRPLLALLLLAGVVAGCGDDDDDSNAATGDTDATEPAEIPEGPTITIGAQDFGESAILSEIYSQVLADRGYDVEVQSLGSQAFRPVEIPAFENGEINFAPEYAASMLEYLNEQAGEATSDANETVDLLEPYLEELDLFAFEVSEAVNTNSFVVTQETADSEGLATISDLADHEDLTLGGPADCETNPFCIPGLQRVYDVDLSSNFTVLDPGVVGDALEEEEIDIGIIFSTDGRIQENGWVLLEDDQTMLAADNVVPVAANEVVDAYGLTFEQAVDEVSAALTTEALTEMNKRYDIDKEDAEVIAADWIEENLQ